MMNNYTKLSLRSKTQLTKGNEVIEGFSSNASLKGKGLSWLVMLVVLLSLATGQKSWGQSLANYSYSTDLSGTLDPMTGATSLAGTGGMTTGYNDDNASAVTNIGFTFFFMGTPYTQFSVTSNGQMRLGSTAISGGAVTSTSAGVAYFAPMAGDNSSGLAGDLDPVSYVVTGTPGNRILKVQWKNFKIPFSSSATQVANMQVWLYETTGVIEYIYGGMVTNASTSRSTFISSSNTATTAGYNVVSSVAATNPTFVLAGSPTTNSYALGNITNLYSAADGVRRVLRFTPNFTSVSGDVTALTFSAVTTSTTTVNFVDSATNEAGFIITRATDAGFTQNVVTTSVATTTSGTTGTAYTSAQTGLTPGTTYFYKVQAIVEAGISTGVSSSQATTASATYYWVGTSGNLWSTAANWNTQADGSGSTRSTPLTTDILIVDGAGTVAGGTMSILVDAASYTIGQLKITSNTNLSLIGNSAVRTLTISGSPGDDFVLESGSTLNLNASGTSPNFAVAIAFTGIGNTGSIAGILNLGGSTSNTFSSVGGTGTLVTVTGTVNNTIVGTGNYFGGSTATLSFANGSTYNITGATTGITIPSATWGTTSNLLISGITSATSMTNASQSYGNVTYNCSSASGTMSMFTTSTTGVVKGNLTISATGTGRFRALTSGTLTVQGNLTLTSGIFEVASSTGTLIVNGNVTINGGTFDIAQGGASTLRVLGNFIQNAPSTLLQTNTGGLLDFSGTSAQTFTLVTGSHGTNAINARVNNAAGVNLTADFSVRNLTISNGNLSGAVLTYGASSVLTYNSTTAAQTISPIEFPAVNGPVSLTINNTAASPNNTVQLNAPRTLGTSGILTLTNGILVNSGSVLTIANPTENAIVGGSATSYVKGDLYRTLASGLATGTTYNFPIGFGSYNPFALVNPTTIAGTNVTVRATVYDNNTGGVGTGLVSSINTNRSWFVILNDPNSNLTGTLVRLSDTPGVANAIGFSSDGGFTYGLFGGTTPTVTGTSITSVSPPVTTNIGGFFAMATKASPPALTNLAISPTGNQCTNVARIVTVTATPGAAPVSGVSINYSVNGVAQAPVAMTNSSGNDWTGVIPTVSPVNATVAWSVTATDTNNIIASATGTSYKDEPLTGITATASASNSQICGAAGTTVLTATLNNTPAVLGAGASTSSSAGASMFSGTWGGHKTQYIIRASELTALGQIAGNITSVAFEATTAFNGYQGFTLSIGNTTATTAAFPLITTGLTEVYTGGGTNGTYATTVGINTLTFSTPFNWDGTSNIVLSFCWSKNPVASSTTGTTVKVDTVGFTCTASGQKDNTLPASFCPLSVASDFGTTTTGTSRPKFIFVINPAITSVSWAGSNGSSYSGNNITINPTTTATYTATIANLTGCNAQASTLPVVITTVPTPPSSLGSTQCGSGIPTAILTSTSGLPTPTFKWYADNSTSTALQSSTSTTFTSVVNGTTTFYVSEANGICESARTAVTVTVDAPPTLVVTPTGDSTYCGTGGSGVITASSNDPLMTYSWSSLNPLTGTIVSAVGGILNYSVTATSIFRVIGTPVTNGACAPITVDYTISVFPLPTTTLTAPDGICPGGTATITSNLSSGSFQSSSIPFAALTPPPSSVVLATGGVALVPAQTTTSFPPLDDGGWPAIPFGFDFNFFGTNYSTINIGTNATLQFGAFNSGSTGLGDFSFSTLPSTTEPLNMVAVLAMDNDIEDGGTVRYWTEGTSPNRKFVVSYEAVRQFSSPNVSTAQAIFYETTGVIEVHVTSSSNQTTNKLVGVNNSTGTIGTLAYQSGTAATANNPIINPFAYRFTPPNDYTTTWTYRDSTTGGNFVAFAPPRTGTNLFTQNVNPTQTTDYNLSYTNTTTGCTNPLGSTQITINVLSTTAPSTVAVASVPAVCLGSSVDLSLTGAVNSIGSTTGLTYQWQVSTDGGANYTDVASATSATLTVSPTVPSLYLCNVTSCSGTAVPSTPVAVGVNIPGTISVSPNVAICTGGSTVLTASALTGTINSYTWSPVDGLSATSGSSVTASPTSTTTYSVFGTDSNNCQTVAVPVTVTVNPYPSAVVVTPSTPASGSLLQNGSVCYGSTVRLEATGGNTTTNYVWTTVPASSLYIDSGLNTLYNPGDFASVVYATSTLSTTYRASVTSLGCTTPGETTLGVTPLPTFTVAPITICNGSSGILSAVTAEDNSYSWTGGLSGQSVSVNPTVDTTYQVVATSNTTTPACSSAPVSVLVTVNNQGSITQQPTNQITATTFGATFTVAGTLLPVPVPYTYQWQIRTSTTPSAPDFDPTGTWSNVLNSSNYSGVTTNTLTVSNASSALNNTVYRCILTPLSPCAPLVSSSATLTVSPVGIETNPQDLVLCLPAPTSPLPQFNVVTNGTGTILRVQWEVSTNNFATTTVIPLYLTNGNLISSGYTGPNTTAVPGLTFEFPLVGSVRDYKTLMISGINASTANNYRFRVRFGVSAVNILPIISQSASLNINSPVEIITNLSAVAIPPVCQVPAPASPTVLSITTSGVVQSIVWKYATTAGASDASYSPVTNGVPAGATYSSSNPLAGQYQLSVATTSATPIGNYYYKAFITSVSPCSGISSSEGVISVIRPTISVSPSATSYCTPSGSPVILTASGSDIGSYSWTAPGFTTTTGTSITVSPAATTIYTVSGTDSHGCTNVATATVTKGDSIVAIASTNSGIVCPSTQVTLAGSVDLAVPNTTLPTQYTFSASSGTYTPLTAAATVLATQTVTSGTPAGALDDVNYTLALPFGFKFGGTTYNSGSNLYVNTNGFVSFGANPPSTGTYGPIGSTNVYDAALSAFGNDLNGGYAATGSGTNGSPVLTITTGNTSGFVVGAIVSGTGVPTGATVVSTTPTTVTLSANCTSTGTGRTYQVASGKISYEVLGSSPNRKLVIQYTKMRPYNVTLRTLDFQIVLNETSNSVAFVYGNAITSGTTTSTVQVGLRGVTNANYVNRTSTTSWAATTAGVSNTSSVTFGGSIVPATGQTFLYSPSIPTATYVWSSAGGFSANTAIVNVNPTVTTEYTLTATSASGCSATTTVQVNVDSTPPTILTVPAPQTICNGDSVSFNVIATSSTPITYRWRKDGVLIPLTNASAGTDTLTLTNTTPSDSGSYTVDVIGCTTVSSTSYALTVNPAPAAVTASGAGTFCSVTSITASNGGDGTIYFQGTTSGGTSTTIASTSESITSSGTYYFRAQSAAGCWGPEGSVAVVIQPLAGITVTPANSCQNEAGTALAATAANCIDFTGGAAALNGTFTTSDPQAPRPITGTTCSFSTTSRGYQAKTFTVQVTGTYTFAMSSTFDTMAYITTGAFTPGSCATGTFIVADDDAGPDLNPQLVANLTAGVVYTLYSTTFSELTSDIAYTWAVTPPVGGGVSVLSTGNIVWFTAASGGTSIGTGSSFNPVGVLNSGLANTSTPGTTTFYAACSGSTTCRTPVTYTIHPTPTVAAIANQLYYNGLATASIPLSGTPSGVTFDISGGASVGLINQTVSTEIPSFTPLTGTATVTVTPKANGCTGPSVTYNITVLAVTADQVANQTYCQGITTSEIPLTYTPISLTGVTFDLQVVGDNIGLSNGTGLTAIPAFVTQPGSATIYVTPVYGGVSGGVVSATITVNPLPTATIAGTTQVCQNDASPSITFTGAVGLAPYTFTYKLNGGLNQTIVSSGSGATATIAVPTGTAGTFEYTLVSVQDSSSTTCSQAQGGVATVIVHPTPTVTTTLNNMALYSGFATATIPLAGTPSGVTFNITGGAAAGLADVYGVSAIPSFIPTTVPATVTVTPVANGCIGIPKSFQIAYIPVIANITATQCGTVNHGLNNQIQAGNVSVPGYTTTGYRFEVTNTATGEVAYVDTVQSMFKLTDTSIYSYGTTFTIRVAVILNGNVQGFFGNTCSLTTASVQTTKVVTAQCGATLAALNSNINANSVSSTNLYRFRVALASAPTTYYLLERSVPNFNLSMVPGLPLLYETEYKVDVQIRVKLAGFEAWSQYGQVCSIFTPAAPTTSLTLADCELVATSSSQAIHIIPYPGATSYRVLLTGYDIYGDVNYSQFIDTASTTFTLSQFTGLTPDTTYNVEVSINLFGNYTPYGKTCSVTTPLALKTALADTFKAVAYPNPFANNFMIDVKSSSQSSVNLKVYDMIGRLVEQRDVRVSDLETATIGERYPSGVYNVVVSQDDSVQTVRVVKR
ncbi:T9SS type A sorting domain-containing protein [Flavobacterium sp. AS60]|uniref:Ig-like domain-containing protein n=1 Tax=Flavobacterium anseongense TaxID=2910677 RepID=UPI001F2DA95D|nr:T9SS type A sorting domain-containing protein [Flavobacterium sp. AS60]MCF6130239.1 T9SS type A sorting domain-containing protein [Flavobacterium sp. AS60]